MGKIKKDKVDNKKGETFRQFEYGDLKFQCYHCGHLELIEEGVKDGIQLTLPTTDMHKWTIVCPRCTTKFEFFFTENTKKTLEEKNKKVEVTDEGFTEDSKEV